MKQVLPKLCKPAPGRNMTFQSFKVETSPPFLCITFELADLGDEGLWWPFTLVFSNALLVCFCTWGALILPDSTRVAGAKGIFLRLALFPWYKAPFHC